MRKIILLGALCVVTFVSFGQKVDLDKFYFTANYRDLPRQPLDTSFHTFSVTVQTGPLSRLAIRRGEIEDQVQIYGWKRIQNRAHVDIQFRFEDVLIEKTDVIENVEVLKDKNGKETGRRSTFILSVIYAYGAHAKLTDYRGQAIQTHVLASRDQKKKWNSEAFPSAAEANAYFKFGIATITHQLIKQSVSNSISALNNTLTWNYGYPSRTVSDFFWILDSRKHPEYENHRRAWIDFKQAIVGMSADEPLDDVRAELKPVIEYFLKVAKNYNSGSKADKKLRYASFYNLSKIHLYLDEPDAAMKYANELSINGFDAKDGNRLEAVAADLKQQLRLAKRTSRHFPLNVQEYQGISYSER